MGGGAKGDFAVADVFTEVFGTEGETAADDHVTELGTEAFVAGAKAFEVAFILEVSKEAFGLGDDFWLEEGGFFVALLLYFLGAGGWLGVEERR